MRFILFLALLSTPALAQSDTATAQRTIVVLQQQRNQALDAIVSMEVERARLAEEVDRLKAEIAKLKKAE